MNNPMDIPIILPINANPILGRIGMEQLHVVGVLLIVGLVVACTVIVWKGLHRSSQRQVENRLDNRHRDLDQAA
jgi:hypothetical protein